MAFRADLLFCAGYRNSARGRFPQAQRFLCVPASLYKKVGSCANISAGFQCKQIFRSASRIPPLVTPGGVIRSHENG
jgi:hypothetical protein